MITSPSDGRNATTAGAAAAELAYDMSPQRQYQVLARGADMWFRVVKAGGTAATVAGSDCHFVPKNSAMLVGIIADRNRISFIRDAGTDVTCVLSELVHVVQ